ncbi:MAG: hypothetical protein ONB42_18205 [candidate division KSB1 bacterium]|nr:hypothetical protein [candidate division KSB1 bacterium]MDZ7313151.1 hypothetical protein [candidate division KSB1 bacterium]
MLIVLGQGVGAVYLLGMNTEGNFKRSALIGSINFTVAILIIVSNFFPIYRPTSAPLRSFHPMQQWKRGLFSTLCDIATLRIVLVSVFYLILLISPVYNVSDLALSSITVITAMMVERSFRLILDFSISMRLVHAITNILIMAMLGGNLMRGIRESTEDELPIAIGVILAALVHHFILTYITAGVPSSSHYSAKAYSTRSLKKGFEMSCRLAFVYLRSPLVRSALGTGMFFKVLALFLLSRIIKNGDLTLDPYFLFYLVAAPITPFNSVLNNAFGHGVSFWGTVRLHTSGSKQNVVLYIQFCLFPCVLDMLIAFVAAFSSGLLNDRFVFFYAGVLIMLSTIGYWSSLLYPRFVKSLPSFTNPRSNTSPLMSFALTIPIAAAFAAAFDSIYLFVLVVLSLIALFITALIARRNYRYFSQRTYAILHS